MLTFPFNLVFMHLLTAMQYLVSIIDAAAAPDRPLQLQAQDQDQEEQDELLLVVDEDSVFTFLDAHMVASEVDDGPADLVCEYLDFRLCSWCLEEYCVGNFCEACA